MNGSHFYTFLLYDKNHVYVPEIRKSHTKEVQSSVTSRVIKLLKLYLQYIIIINAFQYIE